MWTSASVSSPLRFCDVRNPTERIREGHYNLLMLMEDAMTNPDNNTLYVLICSLAATVISLPAVWYFTAAAYAAPGLV
jgi:hypothetical protein